MEIGSGSFTQSSQTPAPLEQRPLEQVTPAGDSRDRSRQPPPAPRSSGETQEGGDTTRTGGGNEAEPGRRRVITGPAYRAREEQGRTAPSDTRPQGQPVAVPAISLEQQARIQLTRSRLLQGAVAGRADADGRRKGPSIPPGNPSTLSQALHQRYRTEVPTIDMDLTA